MDSVMTFKKVKSNQILSYSEEDLIMQFKINKKSIDIFISLKTTLNKLKK